MVVGNKFITDNDWEVGALISNANTAPATVEQPKNNHDATVKMGRRLFREPPLLSPDTS